jgi:hypothetical protein
MPLTRCAPTAFDAMCADRYAGDEFVTGRTVREDYSQTPKG